MASLLAITIVIAMPSRARSQSPADIEAIQGAVLLTLARVAARDAHTDAVVFWTDSASARQRLAKATGVDAASAEQLACRANVCREPAAGVRVFLITTPRALRDGVATATVEELRGRQTAKNSRWTERLVHTLQIEKKDAAWTVTSGTVSIP